MGPRAGRSQRSGRGLTQEAAAEAAGLTWRHLQRVEAGDVNVTVLTLLRLVTAYSSDLDQLFTAGEG